MKRSNVCVITGASTGIGQAIAQALLASGRHVVNLDFQRPEWAHPLMQSVQVDLSSEAEVESCARTIAADSEVTGLVNNAGTSRPGTVDDQSAQDLDHVVALHLRAPLQLTQAFLPTLRSCGHGRIVNVSSRAALGMRNRLAYSTSKAGLIGMTRTMALELGREGITVNVVAPGPIATPLFKHNHPEGSESAQRILQSIVVGKMGVPDDVARAVLFFLAPENGFVTGQVLYVCGGTTLGSAPV
ncbi:SDR family NAD(P)-dependent oxidoreductase [Variovorax saccharolyticus]|uniref:SDR family NAD(P)-dependent oxidoreductase n=1 Tax=Variovorax saccharolyticus TaxID=3053516 RepID=UPI002577E49A|nr:SDR family oxidoreductase [Variovorax sp. J22R187]MDM0022216.1 SDR family oxidoreductase [Variovorax sp. J22R187]